MIQKVFLEIGLSLFILLFMRQFVFKVLWFCCFFPISKQTFKCDNDIVWEQRSISRHALLERCNLQDKFAKMGWCLVSAHVRLGQPWVQCPPLVLFELLNECVFHLGEERCVEFVPLGCLQISLLEDRSLAEDVHWGANIQIPTSQLRCIALVCTVKLLDVVLGVLDDNLMWLPIQSENNDDIVLLTVLDPPWRELQTLNLICTRRRGIVS